MTYIPYGRQTISEEDINAVVSVMRSSYLTQGPIISQFENCLSEKLDSKYSIVVNSATSALHLACLALGLKEGDRFWTSPTTFVASANCGLYCGASVDFVDIDPLTGLMCPDALEQKLVQASKSNTLPKLIIPVHLCGVSCDMYRISNLANRYGVAVIEDASHAIGGQYLGRPIGNCSFSSISIFSFHPVKIITTGEGGLATTNDPILAQTMFDLRSHGITKDNTRFKTLGSASWKYEQQHLGFNYRLTDIQAALGLSQLGRLESIVTERKRLFHVYLESLVDIPANLLSIPDNVQSSHHLAIIRLHNKDPQYHQSVFDGLRASQIGVQLHYLPVHLHPYFRRFGFAEGDFPNAESYAHNAITLPLFPGLKEEEQNRVLQVLTDLIC